MQDENTKELDDSNDYPTLADLMRDQNTASDLSNTVHHRRDLDSLG
tara:strand:- start:1676 stop:1813 length:138 start_codon:yes stop_codon:yes gene_type:complete